MLYKKEYWWMWLLLFIFTGGTMTIFIASDLKLLDKDAWYMNYKNWLIATLCFIFPVTIMFVVFTIEMTCKVAAKLEIPGKELYLSPYIWLLLLIIPISVKKLFCIISSGCGICHKCLYWMWS